MAPPGSSTISAQPTLSPYIVFILSSTPLTHLQDVPDRVPDLISQRRRWLNGSFFASIHSSYHFGYLYRSDHTFWRKLWLHVELVYQAFNMIFAWVSSLPCFCQRREADGLFGVAVRAGELLHHLYHSYSVAVRVHRGLEREPDGD